MHAQETRSIRQRKEEIERRKEESAMPGPCLHAMRPLCCPLASLLPCGFEAIMLSGAFFPLSRAGIDSVHLAESIAVNN